jgi:hypothetical protein
MNNAGRTSGNSSAVIRSALAAWLGLGACVGFLAWVLGFGLDGPGAPQAALESYGRSLLTGLAVSGVAVALGAALGQGAWLARASYASCLFYAGFLATLGWRLWPWLLLAAAAALLASLRRRDFTHATQPLLLLHAMGSLGGLYAALQLRTFITAWPMFRNVLSALWLLLTSLWDLHPWWPRS